MTLLSKGGPQLDRVTARADGSYVVAVPGPLVYDVELADVSEGEADALNQPSSARP